MSAKPRESKFTPGPQEVEVGQVWLDWDKRFRNSAYQRKITVERIDAAYAYCSSDGRPVRIKLSRFRPNSTGYKLLSPAPCGEKGR